MVEDSTALHLCGLKLTVAPATVYNVFICVVLLLRIRPNIDRQEGFLQCRTPNSTIRLKDEGKSIFS